MEKLMGKVAVITGGVTEINAAIANKINAEGGKAIILADEAVEAEGIVVVKCDIGSLADTERAINEIKAAYGDPFIFVSNPQGSVKKGVLDITFAEWDAVMEKNVNSMYNICKQIFPAMKEIGGRVIAISDSKVMGAGNAVDHVSAEAAAHGFTAAVAREMVKYGVTSNVLRINDDATADDVADAVVFVSSAEGRFLNKGELPVQHFPA
jgi:acetoacetyl-CoA reductase